MTIMLSAVINPARGLARYAAANARSAGSPIRFNMLFSMKRRFCGESAEPAIELAILPGQIAFTVMPSAPTACARFRVKASTPPLDAA